RIVAARPQSNMSFSVPATTRVLIPKRRAFGGGPAPVPSRITFRSLVSVLVESAVEDCRGAPVPRIWESPPYQPAPSRRIETATSFFITAPVLDYVPSSRTVLHLVYGNGLAGLKRRVGNRYGVSLG